jgi:ankyrin repeat protein
MQVRHTRFGGRVVAAMLVALVVSMAQTVTAQAIKTSLTDAAMNGDTETVRALLAGGQDVDVAQGDGMTALHWAAFRDDVKMAALLVEADADVAAATRVGGILPLWLAATNGSAAMIDVLVDGGALVTWPTSTGATPLMAAATAGRVDAVERLLNHGAFVNARETANGQTALMFAAWENRADVIRLLVERGAHVGLTSLVVAMDERRFDRDGNELPRGRPRAPGANSMMGGMTALLYAARDGHLEAVRALVENGAIVDQVAGSEGSSPIVIAVANGHYTAAKLLLDAGADPNIANIDGLAPLYATINMRFAPVSWAPNPRTDQERVDAVELLSALLDAGADPNARIARGLWFSPTSHNRLWINPAGATPFWRAAQASDVESMRLLLAAGADANIPTFGGTTPLMVASGIGWRGNFSQNAPESWMKAVHFLSELGAEVTAADGRGYTALHGAAALGDHEMVEFLVSRGADVTAINRDGNSAADMAFGPSRFFIPKPEMAQLLVALGSPFQDNCRSDQCVDGKFFGGATTAQP